MREYRLFTVQSPPAGLLHTGTMTDRKAVIKNADMSEDMQQDAVDCATQAMEKYNIEKDIAAYIKKVCGFCAPPTRGIPVMFWMDKIWQENI